MKEDAAVAKSDAQTAVEIRHCESIEEYKECVELERLTWGPSITVPTSIFVVAHHTGGQILGAYEGGKMVGFTLAMAGTHNGKLFLHSHMTAVIPEYQNRGVGRKLKLFQRVDALDRGIPVVEWTFDPLELKNARFNIARLGAIARRFIPNCYGITESPVHSGLPTDRLVAEWWLDSERVKSILAGKTNPVVADAKRLSLPAEIGKLKAEDRAAGAGIQTVMREQFDEYFARRYVVTDVEFGAKTVDYVLEPAGVVAGLRLPDSNKQ